MKNKAVLLCCGEGGHEEQAKRLLELLVGSANSSQLNFPLVISITDSKLRPKFCVEKHFFVSELRSKYKKSMPVVSLISSFLRALITLYKVLINYDVSCLISTGPGVSFFPALICKALRIKVIHIETWSRFYTRSLAGRIMYKISDVFIIQNKELSEIYPNAIYGGRL